MAYIQNVSSGSWYTGNAYNLTPLQVEVLWVLASLFVAAGWRVLQSGDGLSTYSTTDGSAITNISTTDPGYSSNDGSTYAKIAGSLANNRAWLILATPAAAAVQGQLALQLISAGGSSLDLRVKFSAGGFANATSATTTPAATAGAGDQVLLLGGGTDASPTGTGLVVSNGSCRMNAAVDNSTSTPRAWCTLWDAASDTMRLGFVWDFVDQLLTASDTYPYVVGAVEGGWEDLFSDVAAIGSSARCAATRFGGSATTKVALLTRYFHFAATDFDAVGVNSLNSKEDTLLVEWARPSSAGGARGLKGASTMIRQRGTSRSNGDNLTTTITREYVHANGLWVPWAITGTACVR
jgi:hypothetical protein